MDWMWRAGEDFIIEILTTERADRMLWLSGEEMLTDENDCEDDMMRKRTFLMSHGHAE